MLHPPRQFAEDRLVADARAALKIQQLLFEGEKWQSFQYQRFARFRSSRTFLSHSLR
jgi:hypothetical protein